ncbi:Hypp5927 [Branchiostoma lanceolatum]|uniref:Hypp5927 protein n=1 Tax=Branchiostoma lanceolatum TaxID=7740 RepID=A0A8J9W5I9_BRALA|nr:Hypp5927 [Branchiostoma lanceolatum]
MALSAADMATAKEAWAKLTSSSFEDAGEKVFLALLKDDAIKSNFKKFKDIPYGSLPGNADMRAHGAKVCKVLDDFINGDDGAAKKIGAMHKGLGMSNDQISDEGRPCCCAGGGGVRRCCGRLGKIVRPLHGGSQVSLLSAPLRALLETQRTHDVFYSLQK